MSDPIAPGADAAVIASPTEGVELAASANVHPAHTHTNGSAGPTLLAPHPQSPTDGSSSVRIMMTDEGADEVGELGSMLSANQMRTLEKPNRLRQESELKRIRMMRGATTSPSVMGGGPADASPIPPHKPGKSVPTTAYNSPKDTLLACIKAGLAKSILPVR